MSMDDQGEPGEASSYFDEMERIRTNRGPALSKYQEHLNAMPTREGNQQGKWGKILGGIAAAGVGWNDPEGGTALGNEVLETPYKRATQDWSNKAKGLAESANLEREEKEGELKSLSEARAMGLKYDEYGLKRAETFAKMGIAERAQKSREEINRLTRLRDMATDSRSRTQIQAQIDRWKAQGENEEFTNENGRQNAITGRANAATNARRAKTAEDVAFSMDNYRKGRLEQFAKGKKATPEQLSTAMDSALKLMSNDPVFGKFVQTDESTGGILRYSIADTGPGVLSGGIPQAQVESFQRRLRETIERQVEEGVLLPDPDEDDDNFEIGEPEF